MPYKFTLVGKIFNRKHSIIKVYESFIKFGFCGDYMISLIDAMHILVHLEHKDFGLFLNPLGILMDVQYELSNGHQVLGYRMRPPFLSFGFHFLCFPFTFEWRAFCYWSFTSH